VEWVKKEAKVLIEERYLPERKHLLKSKITSMRPDGSIRKDIKVSFCDFCGQLIGKTEISLCSSCQKKICRTCKIVYETRIYCRDCAKELVQITKEQFLILYGIINEINASTIKKLSSMSLEGVKYCLDVLFERKLIDVKGMSVFSIYVPTDKGLALLPTCEQIYQPEGDVKQYLQKIHDLMEEKNDEH
jgi:RecJ-like exonuclease